MWNSRPLMLEQIHGRMIIDGSIINVRYAACVTMAGTMRGMIMTQGNVMTTITDDLWPICLKCEGRVSDEGQCAACRRLPYYCTCPQPTIRQYPFMSGDCPPWRSWNERN